jgi:hypothetical protein
LKNATDADRTLSLDGKVGFLDIAVEQAFLPHLTPELQEGLDQ